MRSSRLAACATLTLALPLLSGCFVQNVGTALEAERAEAVQADLRTEFPEEEIRYTEATRMEVQKGEVSGYPGYVSLDLILPQRPLTQEEAISTCIALRQRMVASGWETGRCVANGESVVTYQFDMYKEYDTFAVEGGGYINIHASGRDQGYVQAFVPHDDETGMGDSDVCVMDDMLCYQEKDVVPVE